MLSPSGSVSTRMTQIVRASAPATAEVEVEAPAPPAGHAPLAAAALAFALCLAYALLRYVVLKGEPLASVPLYVTNKAIALFAVVLIAAAAARPRATWRGAARATGLFAAALHGLASVVLLRPAYLAKLHAPGGRLTGPAELAVICGVVALVAFASLRLARPERLRSQGSRRWAARGALALVGVHCAALGMRGWLHPAGWPAGLPPLTLLGALAVVVGLALALRADGLRDNATPVSAGWAAEPRPIAVRR